ncbi:transposase family protein [Streptomyces antnestii]|uniref:transposase family protein n=1 Tax=Streptomyces antnestii TaxID=2494256 RepID=UPI003D67536C
MAVDEGSGPLRVVGYAERLLIFVWRRLGSPENRPAGWRCGRQPSVVSDVLPLLDELLFSSVEGVLVESVEVTDTVVRVEARATAGRAASPECGYWSGRIHGSYLRFPHDLPTAGKLVVVSLRVRRFVCAEGSCPRTTFAEQVPGLTRRFGRRTERLRSTCASVPDVDHRRCSHPFRDLDPEFIECRNRLGRAPCLL